MILPDSLLREHLDEGRIVCRPLGENAIRPASIDVRLGRRLLIAEYDGHREHDLIDSGPLTLDRSMFVLGSTLEWIEVPDHLAAVLAGKSTRARQGLILENAGYVDPGWKGELTLELSNLAPRPVRLVHGLPIGQLRFELLLVACERPYGSDASSHYQQSRGPVLARSEVAS